MLFLMQRSTDRFIRLGHGLVPLPENRPRRTFRVDRRQSLIQKGFINKFRMSVEIGDGAFLIVIGLDNGIS